ncbi:MAG: hypothetical protein IT429_22880, partial [Gemmataceae bacterium]|nr:hypothetical protein [Gemmataceae bacterium]
VLDHRLVEYCFGLPADLLLNRAVTKVVLRQAMRGIVPDRILDRKDKLAYAPPQRQWLHGPLHAWVEQHLVHAEQRTDVFNPRSVLGIRERLDDGGETLAWRVASTEAWFREMVDARPGGHPGAAEVGGLEW